MIVEDHFILINRGKCYEKFLPFFFKKTFNHNGTG